MRRLLGMNIDGIGKTENDFFQNIELIKKVGFDSVFIIRKDSDAIYDKYVDFARKVGLFFETIHSSFLHINNIWLDNLDGEDKLNDLIDCADFTSNHKIPTMIVHLSSGFNPPYMSDIGFERFKKLIDFAGNRDINIAFENTRKFEYLQKIFELFHQNNVRFCFDFGHSICYTPGTEYLPKYKDLLICTHIHDNRAIFGQDDHLIPFDGKCDFNIQAKRIKEANYKGPLTLEAYANDQMYQNVKSNEEFIAKAFHAVSKFSKMCE